MKAFISFTMGFFFCCLTLASTIAAPGDYYLTNGTQWVVIASRPTVAEAQDFAKQFMATTAGTLPKIFLSSNGQYAIVLGPYKLTDVGQTYVPVPSDAYLASGKNFDSEIDLEEVAAIENGEVEQGEANAASANVNQQEVTIRCDVFLTFRFSGDAVTSIISGYYNVTLVSSTVTEDKIAILLKRTGGTKFTLDVDRVSGKGYWTDLQNHDSYTADCVPFEGKTKF